MSEKTPQIPRYPLYGSPVVVGIDTPSKTGDWCKYSDVAPLLERIAAQDQRIAELEKAWAVDELALELQGVLPCNEAQVFRDRIAELEAKLTPCKQCSTIAGQPMCHGGNQCNPLAATDVFG